MDSISRIPIFGLKFMFCYWKGVFSDLHELSQEVLTISVCNMQIGQSKFISVIYPYHNICDQNIFSSGESCKRRGSLHSGLFL